MPWMNFDLQDGEPPVGFNLKPDDCDRFVKFMAECHSAQAKESEVQKLIDVAKSVLDLRSMADRYLEADHKARCLELANDLLRDQLAGDGTRFAVVPLEPTEAMYYAGLAVEPGIGGAPPSPRHVWAAMVQAAIKESGQ